MAGAIVILAVIVALQGADISTIRGNADAARRQAERTERRLQRLFPKKKSGAPIKDAKSKDMK